MSLFTIQQLKEIANYEMYERFYNNNFNNSEIKMLDVDSRFYIAANITKSIVDTTADFLLGEAPKISTSDAQQDLIDQIMTTSDFNAVLFDAVQAAALKGKSYIKLYLKEGLVKAQALEPDDVVAYKDLNGDIYKAMILTVIETTESNTTICLKEEMTKEAITRSVIELDESKSIKIEMDVKKHPLTASYLAEEPNYFKIIPLVEVKNNSKALSDIDGCGALILAINKRLSEIDYIISKHADPKMQIPEGVLKKASADFITSNSTTFVHMDGIDNKEFKMLEVKPNDADIKYIQPNLDLSSAYEELDRLVNYLLNQTKTSTALIQSLKDGGQVESAKALKLKLLNTDRKLRQKKGVITKAIKQFFSIACLLMQQPEAMIDIEFIDIINDKDSAVTNAINLYSAGVISKREAIRIAFPGVAEEMVDQMFLETLEENLPMVTK